jgi:hypothetical protein
MGRVSKYSAGVVGTRRIAHRYLSRHPAKAGSTAAAARSAALDARLRGHNGEKAKVQNVRKPTHKRISKYLQRMSAALDDISRSFRSTATAGNAPFRPFTTVARGFSGVESGLLEIHALFLLFSICSFGFISLIPLSSLTLSAT